MSEVRIQTGSIERIEAVALSASLVPLTGLTDLLISIRRNSDGFFFDFNDLTFKSAGWTTRQLAMTEVNSTNAPGEYYYNFNTGTITNPTSNDTYEIRVDQTPGTTVKNIPQIGEIKVGQFIDNIDADISSRSAPGDAMALTVAERNSIRAALMTYVINGNILGLTLEQSLDLMRKILNNKLHLSDGAVDNWVLYDDDDISELLKYSVTDKSGSLIFLEPVTPARRTRGL